MTRDSWSGGKKAAATMGAGKSTGSRGKKLANNAEQTANRKREEFDELVKARTEKLMLDGPVGGNVWTGGVRFTIEHDHYCCELFSMVAFSVLGPVYLQLRFH